MSRPPPSSSGESDEEFTVTLNGTETLDDIVNDIGDLSDLIQ